MTAGQRTWFRGFLAFLAAFDRCPVARSLRLAPGALVLAQSEASSPGCRHWERES
jgi:hypothetical protein